MIRKATLKDIAAITLIETKCFKGDTLSPRSIRYMVTNLNAIMLVYTKDQQVVGYVLTVRHTTRRLAWHYSLAVLPEYRGQGIAKALLLKAETYFPDKEGFKLEVNTKNRRAKKLYEQLGYRPRTLKPGYYEDGSDAIEMVKLT